MHHQTGATCNICMQHYDHGNISRNLSGSTSKGCLQDTMHIPGSACRPEGCAHADCHPAAKQRLYEPHTDAVTTARDRTSVHVIAIDNPGSQGTTPAQIPSDPALDWSPGDTFEKTPGEACFLNEQSVHSDGSRRCTGGTMQPLPGCNNRVAQHKGVHASCEMLLSWLIRH